MNRVLVYRLGSIGDTVVALPAFHLIRQHFASDHITVLTNVPRDQRAAPLASVLPPRLYDDILEYPLGVRNARQLRTLRAQIVERTFTLMISLAESRGFWKSVRDYGFFWSCRIPEIRGVPFRGSDLRNRLEPGSSVYRSETNRLLDRLSWLGTIDSSEDRWWDLELSDGERQAARSILSTLQASKPILAFSVGTKFDTKDWSQPNWMSLMSRLSAAFSDHSLVSIGAESERARSQELLDVWSGKTANLCGRVSPRVSAAVLEQAELFVGHDSGPVHLAAAVGTPCVAVYSARSLPGHWFPRGNKTTVFYNRVPCLGCGLETCVTFAKKCILSIGVDQVFDAVAARLTRVTPDVSTVIGVSAGRLQR